MRDAAAFGQSWVKMAKDIGEILKGETAEKPEAKVEPEKIVEETKPEAPEPKAEKTEEPETPAGEPEDQSKPDKTPSRELGGLKAAVTAERNKRQAAEKQIEDLLAKHQQDIDARERRFLQAMQQFAPKPPEQPQPGIFDDPAAWEQRTTQSFDSKLRQADVKWSERLAIRHYGKDKYAEAERAVEQHIRSNPNDAIVHTLRNSDDPAEDLMQWYEQRTKLNDFSDPKTALTRLLSEATPELKAEILATLGAKAAETEQPSKPAPSALPTNLAGARSVSGNRGAVFKGPAPISEILASRRK